ncbi:MAG: class A beta-lactamase-related serine hydrolase [Candidatus Omnitrophota bacterium]|nr:class A beta-lactamase-related serine hydrolase [Candidatus Omnitrophota bacterium]
MTGRKLYFALSGVFLFLVISLSLLFVYPRLNKERALLERKKAQWSVLRQEISSQARNFKGKSGIVVKDLKMNWEISLNKEEVFPSASLVKIPIMAAVFGAAQSGKIRLESRIKLKVSDKVPGSGELKNIPAGRDFSIEELVERMVISSDNTAANMLIELLGFGFLNNSFKEFGLKNTNLARKMMEFGERKNGVENYTTAEDTSYLLEKIYRHKLCNSFVSEKCLGLLKRQKTRDRIPAQLPEDIIVAHKTGLEMKTCHDTGIVFAPRGDFLICVLTKGVVNSRISKKFISNIAFKVYNNYR